VRPTDVVVLDRASPVPLWYQIATQLAAAIQARDLPGGSSLPERAKLARCWRVCHETVHHALEMLVADGLVVRPRPGVYLVRL
jgi:GntR family transcriptional regulator